jgi:spermidine/putrescine transport system ATP-binding protein
LDLKLRQAMQVELKRIQREVGITFIYVTHDQEEALTMSDRIAVMNEGRVEQIAPPEEIYHAPSTVFVANFIGVANLIPARVSQVRSGQAEVTVAGSRPFTVPTGSWTGQPGSAATVTVRPERIRLTKESSGPMPAVPATVQHVIFQGPVTRCLLKTADGTEIVAHVGHDDAHPDLAPGQSIQVCWDAEAGRLLPPAKS